ncbi:hypothetical protein SmJEL517_g01183 [Synchytrium microbalum]|uniref:Histone deacetylase n=1 Tax=Synchytrium microbalum TaxID=1806994 RepID=A0A507CAP0_9FUNG|nr:uncharacterized protein SmJEL517_g01183 [Synchytrium microbalum]TPX36521.1 hypothetical protein SmJEL517_g01183 [Synchytrium microbalum]
MEGGGGGGGVVSLKRPLDCAHERQNNKKAHFMEINPPNKQRRVGYVFSHNYMNIADLLPSNIGRSRLVHGLIHAYSLPSLMIPIHPQQATMDQLSAFHEAEYLKSLTIAEQSVVSVNAADFEEYGLEHDCPVFPGLTKYCSYVAGSSITAAQQLVSGTCDAAIHWDGGRHHAQRDKAAGFCYVNDIVLGILELRTKFSRILYIDVDVHHGDGVEQAFLFSNRVTTLSFHRADVGFYPGKGKGYALNIPLKQGLSGPSLLRIFLPITRALISSLKPDCIVLCLGADGLSGDRLKGGWNLDVQTIPAIVREVMTWSLPTLMLGGGGYNSPNCARTWTLATAAALGVVLPDEIPEHDALPEFGPDFLISAPCGNMTDYNLGVLGDIVEDVLGVLTPAAN